MLIICPSGATPIASAEQITCPQTSEPPSKAVSTQPLTIPQSVFAEVLKRIQQGPAGIQATKLVEPAEPAITVNMLISLKRV